jgi:uncharacterized protein YnzC (UPF0291/DUF896 family)
MEKTTTEKNNSDQLRQNYLEMGETEKEILEKTAAQFKKVWISLNEIQKRQTNNGLSEKEINMWSILIGVLKNQNRDYNSIEDIIGDICDIKELIKSLK